jgi:hypothetical protein
LHPSLTTGHSSLTAGPGDLAPYAHFAAAHRPLFDLLYEAGLSKARYPEIEEAERPIDEGFTACVLALVDANETAGDDLAPSIKSPAHGPVTLLLDGDCDAEAIDGIAERAARATRALVESRHLLRGISHPGR